MGWAFSLVDVAFPLADRTLTVRVGTDITHDGDPARGPVPLGLSLWPSGVVLARELMAQPAWVAGQAVLELGCGPGLGSLVCAVLGAERVTATDGDARVADVVAHNAGVNALPVEFRTWAWGASGAPATVSRVIGSDLLYETAAVNDVCDALAATLAPGGQALLVDPGRPSLDRFLAKLEARGFACTTTRHALASTDLPSVVAAAHPRAPGTFTVLRITRDTGQMT